VETREDEFVVPDFVGVKVFINNADIFLPLSFSASRVYMVTKKCQSCLVNTHPYNMAHEEITSRSLKDCQSEWSNCSSFAFGNVKGLETKVEIGLRPRTYESQAKLILI
jgi:hypothetical protein